MNRRKISLAISLIMLLTILSCVANRSYVKNSYDILAASQSSYDMALSIAADVYIRGLMSEDAKASILKAGNVYATAHNTAVDILAKYVESEDLEDQAKVEKQILIVTEALSELLALVKPFIEEID